MRRNCVRHTINIGELLEAVDSASNCGTPVAWGGEVFLDAFKSSALNREVKFTIYLSDGYKDSSDRLRPAPPGVSGDHDRLGIALMSAQLYWRLFQVQPKQVELRIVDGDHEWLVFRDALPDALQYVDRQCERE